MKKNMTILAIILIYLSCQSCNVFAVVNQSQVISQDVLYKTIIDMKDDKIVLLSNIINWILAGLAIAIASLIVLFGFLYNNIKNKYKELVDKLELTNGMIDNLEIKSGEIDEVQKNIKIVLSSETYKSKLQDLDGKINKLSLKIKEVENKALTSDELNNEFGRIVSSVAILDLKPFLIKIIEHINLKYKEKIIDEDKEKLLDLIDKRNNFIINIDVETDSTEDVVIKLKEYKETSLYLYKKYRDLTDLSFLSELREYINPQITED